MFHFSPVEDRIAFPSWGGAGAPGSGSFQLFLFPFLDEPVEGVFDSSPPLYPMFLPDSFNTVLKDF